MKNTKHKRMRGFKAILLASLIVIALLSVALAFYLIFDTSGINNDNIIYTKMNNNHYHLPNARHLKEQISVYPTTKVKEIK